MDLFTAAYLARLESWGLLAVGVQGVLVLASWRAWDWALARASAASRHRVACLHFTALLVLPLLTVALLHGTLVGVGVTPPHGSPVGELPALIAGYRRSAWLGLVLALAWLAGAAVMARRLVLDARRLRALHPTPAPAAWAEAVQRLARDRVRVRAPRVVTADVSSPQVVGCWRPRLLAPRDLAERLTPPQWEAVLLHELAHVRRGDFGWNLLQRAALSLLWFHPAAWALYLHLAREREACCDALAVRHGASAPQLARALVCLAERRADPGIAMPAAAQGELAPRIHRLLGMPAPALPPWHARALAMGMTACCLAALGAGRLGLADASLSDLCHASAFGPTLAVLAHDPAGSFDLRIRRGRVVAASVDAQRVPAERIAQVGDRVALLDPARVPLVVLTVTPQGRIEWLARR